jgi:hypothetical protein
MGLYDKKERIERAVKKMPANVKRNFEGMDFAVSRVDPYFSRGRISASTIVVSGGVHTITVPAQRIRLFDYGQNDAMTAAGFPAAAPFDRATKADTNLRVRGETNAGEFVVIDGISLHIHPRSEPEILRRVWAEIDCTMTLESNEEKLRFGNPMFLGGGGGLVGQGVSQVTTPNAFDTRSVAEGFISNGFPGLLDFKQLEDPIVWGPKGLVDSQLAFVLNLTRTVTIVAAARAANATVGIPAFTPPVAQTAPSDVDGTFVDLMVVLHSVQIAQRSVNG